MPLNLTIKEQATWLQGSLDQNQTCGARTSRCLHIFEATGARNTRASNTTLVRGMIRRVLSKRGKSLMRSMYLGWNLQSPRIDPWRFVGCSMGASTGRYESAIEATSRHARSNSKSIRHSGLCLRSVEIDRLKPLDPLTSPECVITSQPDGASAIQMHWLRTFAQCSNANTKERGPTRIRERGLA